MPKALVLLSGGLDSLVALASALEENRQVICLSFNYGQRHAKEELFAAQEICKYYQVPKELVHLDAKLFKSSKLVSCDAKEVCSERTSAISSSYVPARNTLFLAYATAFAEVLELEEIYIGANKEDQSGFPDCRAEFFKAFQSVLQKATKQSFQGRAPKICTPLLTLSKQQIVALGRKLKAPLSLSFSCYFPIEGLPCNECLACKLRNQAFLEVP